MSGDDAAAAPAATTAEAAVDEAASQMTMHLRNMIGGQQITVHLGPSATVDELRQATARQLGAGLLLPWQRVGLLCGVKTVNTDVILSDLLDQRNATSFLVRALPARGEEQVLVMHMVTRKTWQLTVQMNSTIAGIAQVLHDRGISLSSLSICYEGELVPTEAYSSIHVYNQLPLFLVPSTAAFADIFSLVLAQMECGGAVDLHGRPLSDEDIMNIATIIRDSGGAVVIDLSGCGITEAGAMHVADAIRNSPDIGELRLMDNEICGTGAMVIATALPYCKQLKYVKMRGNKLTDADIKSFARFLPQCPSIRQFFVSDNLLTALGWGYLLQAVMNGANPRMLDISGWLPCAHTGKRIDPAILEAAELEAAVGASREALMAYVKEAHAGAKPQKSRKPVGDKYDHLAQATRNGHCNSTVTVQLVFIGRGGAGKSTLRSLLATGSFDSTLTRTEGLCIQEWETKLEEENEQGVQAVRFRVVDCGGQDIYYSTHAMFFANKAIYCLLVNARTTSKDLARTDVRKYSKEVATRASEAPILVVATNTEGFALPADCSAAISEEQTAMAGTGMRAGVFQIDSKTEKGVADLKAALTKEAAKLMHVRRPVPISYTVYLTLLRQAGADSDLPIVTREKALWLATKCGFKPTTRPEQVLQFLHDTGAILSGHCLLHDGHEPEPDAPSLLASQALKAAAAAAAKAKEAAASAAAGPRFRPRSATEPSSASIISDSPRHSLLSTPRRRSARMPRPMSPSVSESTLYDVDWTTVQLSDVIVTDAEWLAELVSGVITGDATKMEHVPYGILRRSQFKKIWPKLDERLHAFVLELLHALGLAFPVNKNVSIVPSMLPPRADIGDTFLPPDVAKGEKEACVSYTMQDNPLDLMAYLTSKLACCTALKVAWTEGVVCEVQGMRGCVSLHHHHGGFSIEVHARGVYPPALIAVVCGCLDELLKERYTNLKPEVELVCHRCHHTAWPIAKIMAEVLDDGVTVKYCERSASGSPLTTTPKRRHGLRGHHGQHRSLGHARHSVEVCASIEVDWVTTTALGELNRSQSVNKLYVLHSNLESQEEKLDTKSEDEVTAMLRSTGMQLTKAAKAQVPWGWSCPTLWVVAPHESEKGAWVLHPVCEAPTCLSILPASSIQLDANKLEHLVDTQCAVTAVLELWHRIHKSKEGELNRLGRLAAAASEWNRIADELDEAEEKADTAAATTNNAATTADAGGQHAPPHTPQTPAAGGAGLGAGAGVNGGAAGAATWDDIGQPTMTEEKFEEPSVWNMVHVKLISVHAACPSKLAGNKLGTGDELWMCENCLNKGTSHPDHDILKELYKMTQRIHDDTHDTHRRVKNQADRASEDLASILDD